MLSVQFPMIGMHTRAEHFVLRERQPNVQSWLLDASIFRRLGQNDPAFFGLPCSNRPTNFVTRYSLFGSWAKIKTPRPDGST